MWIIVSTCQLGLGHGGFGVQVTTMTKQIPCMSKIRIMRNQRPQIPSGPQCLKPIYASVKGGRKQQTFSTTSTFPNQALISFSDQTSTNQYMYKDMERPRGKVLRLWLWFPFQIKQVQINICLKIWKDQRGRCWDFDRDLSSTRLANSIHYPSRLHCIRTRM